jgi:hypothetical protein
VVLRRVRQGWTFTPAEGGTTDATWRYTFTVRPAWLAPIADRIGIALLGRDIRRRLAAFARACADPVVVEAARRLPFAPGAADGGDPAPLGGGSAAADEGSGTA